MGVPCASCNLKVSVFFFFRTISLSGMKHGFAPCVPEGRSIHNASPASFVKHAAASITRCYNGSTCRCLYAKIPFEQEINKQHVNVQLKNCRG